MLLSNEWCKHKLLIILFFLQAGVGRRDDHAAGPSSDSVTAHATAYANAKANADRVMDMILEIMRVEWVVMVVAK